MPDYDVVDYCNSLLNNIAKRDLAKLQRVQNCLARVVLRAPQFSPSLPLLKHLHWLPVSSISQQLIVPKTKLNLGKRAFSVAAPRVWNELLITLKTSQTIAIFRKKTQDVFIPNCISIINVRLSLVLILTFDRPCSRLCLTILFCCASESQFCSGGGRGYKSRRLPEITVLPTESG